MPPKATPPRALAHLGRTRLGKTGLICDDATGQPRLAGFADATCRGVGQVIFLNNSYAGLLCLLAITLSAPLQALAALLGTAIATATGQALGAERGDLRAGLYGYNGCLIAIALPLFLGPGWAVWALTFLAAGLSSALLLALNRIRAWRLPALTAPFVLCSWAAILAFRALAPDPGGSPPVGTLRDVPVPPALLFPDLPLIEASLAGLAQTYLQPSALSGLLIALALLVAAPRFCLLACLASAASATTAALLPLPPEAIRTGLFGFSAVLAALALGAVYLGTSRRSFAIALTVAALMPPFQIACSTLIMPLGLPTMSVPFITATWITLTALALLRRRRV